jgi:hypothetical protein
MNLSGDDGSQPSSQDVVRAAYYCVAEVIRLRQLGGIPVPDWLRRHYNHLDAEVRVSHTRQESEGSRTYSESDLIGTGEAADMLGWNIRKVQRLAADLGGRRVAGRLVFSSFEVHEYAEGLEDGRSGRSV